MRKRVRERELTVPWMRPSTGHRPHALERTVAISYDARMVNAENAPTGLKIRVSQPIADMGNTWRDIGSRLIESKPKPGSFVDELLKGGALDRGHLSPISLPLAAANDHFQAFGRLIRGQEVFGPSVAAVCRSSLESLGRAWWLLESPDTPAFEHRVAAFRVKEAQTAKKHSTGKFARSRPDGTVEELTGQDFLDIAQAEFDSVRLTSEAKVAPGYTDLTTSVLAASSVPSPRSEYSGLSGIVHGEQAAVLSMNRFQDSTKPDIGSLGLPIGLLMQYTWTLSHTVDTVITRWIDSWGSIPEIERWTQVRDRSYDSWQEVNNFLDSLGAEKL